MTDQENNTPSTENPIAEVPPSDIIIPAKEAPEAPACEEKKNTAADDEKQAIIDELHELAYAEAESLEYLPKAVGSFKRGHHSFLKVFFPLLIVFVILFFLTARTVFGKGWIINMINKTGSFQSFTIPIVTHPELEEKYYQPDGRYTVEGVSEVCSPSIVTIEVFVDNTIFAAYGQGSGVIMTEDGYIITNAHVVDDAKLAIIVRLYDGTEYNATLVGADAKTDLAIIKINASDLTPAQFGDSDQLSIGEQVVAIGSPAGFENSVTTGIISGLNRMIKVQTTNISMNCIQIDAAINPGNSGGALLNMWGQVVGITSSKLEAMEYDNIGFAISMNAAKPILEELIENGSILGRPKIGISFREVSDAVARVFDIPAGLHIAEISPESDVNNTDLAPNDVITEMNGIKVRSADDVYAIIMKMHPGDEITAKVIRIMPDGEQTDFEITFKLIADNTASIQPDTQPDESDE